jgi:hypothetical protein
MNSSSSHHHRPKPLASPKYGRCALLTLISLPIFHAVSYLLDLFLLTDLEDQMIKDGNDKGLGWVMFVFSMLMLTLLVVVRAVIYYRDDYRRESYQYETSVNRFGNRGAEKNMRRFDKIVCVEALIILGIHAALWLPSVLLRMLTDMSIGGKGLARASELLQEIFVGSAGLYRPFGIPWIGYGIGVIFVPLCYLVITYFVHRKWYLSYDD